MAEDKSVTILKDDILNTLGKNLKSFIVYGSAASGDSYKGSDINILIILENIGPEVLQTISKSIKKFVSKGNPIPLIFNKDRILKSEDVFPLEFMDIKENNKIIYGENIISKIKISEKNIRLELEREFKSKLIKLRQSYVVTEGRSKEVIKLMSESLSTFIILGKGLLRLMGIKPPRLKRDVVAKLDSVVDVDVELFEIMLDYNEGKRKITPSESDILFKRYLIQLEELSDYTDGYKKAKLKTQNTK